MALQNIQTLLPQVVHYQILPFWKPNGLVLSLVIDFFGGSFTWVGVYLAFSRCSFKCHANMSLLMCGSKGRHLINNSFYHTYISFILNLLLYNSMYLSWLDTVYGCPPFTMLMWSYHWWSKYPFVLMVLREWEHNNLWYISRYYHNYCFGKWNTCSNKGSHLFSHTNNKWISLSPKMTYGPWWTLLSSTQLA